MRYVRLPDEDLEALRRMAADIEESKRRYPTVDWGVDSLESRFLSLCAERCVAVLLGCEHEVAVLPAGDGGVDLVLPRETRFGRTVEVKFRRSRKTDLATASLRFWEELVADIYVLVWPACEQGWEPNQGFTVVGFATKRQFHERILARPPIRMKGEKWEIPWQDLRPIEVLIQEVRDEATHRDRREVGIREDDVGRGSGSALRPAA
ncbi:hypothetical protein HRbin28_02213 [bacterium HR28]|nr:hypothetical protein HRbin28_02213 [bacterium HR28]